MSANSYKSRKPTIGDVARIANVSTATVSYVLNGKNRVGEQARQRVENAVRKLGYQPDMAALGLSSKCTHTVGLVIPYAAEHVFSTPFFPELLCGISRHLSANGYAMLLSTTQPGAETVSAVEGLVRSRGVDGLVFVGTKLSDQPFLEGLVREGVPLVCVGGQPDNSLICSVDADNSGGAMLAVQYLLDQGHKRIGIINGPEEYALAADRLSGYTHALQSAGIQVDPAWISSGPYTVAGGYQCMMKLLEREVQLDAVLVAGDITAVGAYNALVDRGLSIGRDIALVGFGDTSLAAAMQPPMTVVRQPVQKLGTEAVLMLLELMKGETLPSRQVVLPVELVKRGSA